MAIIFWNLRLNKLSARLVSALKKSLGQPALRLASCILMLVAGLLLLISSPSMAIGSWTLPNSSMTPGAVGSVDVNTVCVRGYSRTVRPAYTPTWRRFRTSVFRAYGIPHDQWRRYTIDHLIPLALGGAPEDLRNVWPEPNAEAKRKDNVEDALVAAVCYRHALTLEATQAAIARDWTSTPVGLSPIQHRHDVSE
jgi:hypothetical protein